MVGNTGYLGYPVTLAFVGTQYFAFALFYDLLGTTLAAYGLGVALGAHFGRGVQSHWQLAQAILINPTLWSFGFGLGFRQLPLPTTVEVSLHGLAWTVVALSLVLIGMRLSQLNSWHSLPRASISLGIKMLLVPLILGSSLSLFGLSGSTQLVIVLQMAMPPAFATLVIAEAYNLDHDLTVTALAVGSAGLLVTLPIWLWLF
jgi:predicted permease